MTEHPASPSDDPFDVTSLAKVAMEHHQAGRLEEAEQGYLKVLSHDAQFGHALRLLGALYLQRQQYELAELYLRKALSLFPNSPELLNNLGIALRNQNKFAEAATMYEEVLRIDPERVGALVNIGLLFYDRGQLDEAQEMYEKALSIKPDHADALANLGTIFYDKGQLDEAREIYEKALSIKPDHVEALFGKSSILLSFGHYQEGWELYEARFAKKGLARRIPSPPWDGSPIPDKRLLICCEQGFGDSLQFIRYAALCRPCVGKVLILCPPELVRLFKSCPFVDEVYDLIYEGAFDEHIAMMSLPYLFDTVLETIPSTVPYLHVPTGVMQKWAPKFASVKKLKVGLAWGGRSVSNGLFLSFDLRRSVNLKAMLPLLDHEDVQFYNLQKGNPAKQIDELNLHDRIIDLMDETEDFLDTAAIIENLDLVIAVDTSVAHLAGALAKPVWILSRYDADWRWLQNREYNPWYPTARVFGQTSYGDWDSVIKRVDEALSGVCTIEK